MFVQHHADEILNHYNSPDIAARYGRQEHITPCERLIFDAYIKPGMSILDVGVGGGRTSEYLARSAARYVGIDYAPEMIQICRKKYPKWEYYLSVATDLSIFSDGSFDTVVMCFNVLDDVIPSENRWQCLKECYRVLRRGGYLIFSSHNPRAVFVRPKWESTATRASARPVAAQRAICSRGMTRMMALASHAGQLWDAVKSSACNIIRCMWQAPFWRGEGHMLDHQRLMTHFWIPDKAIQELRRFGFQFIALRGDDYPRKSHLLITGWYYYVFSKHDLAEMQS